LNLPPSRRYTLGKIPYLSSSQIIAIEIDLLAKNVLQGTSFPTLRMNPEIIALNSNM